MDTVTGVLKRAYAAVENAGTSIGASPLTGITVLNRITVAQAAAPGRPTRFRRSVQIRRSSVATR